MRLISASIYRRNLRNLLKRLRLFIRHVSDLFSRGHATLHLAVSVGRLVGNISKLRAVFRCVCQERISIRGCVRPSVRPSVGPYVRYASAMTALSAVFGQGEILY